MSSQTEKTAAIPYETRCSRSMERTRPEENGNQGVDMAILETPLDEGVTCGFSFEEWVGICQGICQFSYSDFGNQVELIK